MLLFSAIVDSAVVVLSCILMFEGGLAVRVSSELPHPFLYWCVQLPRAALTTPHRPDDLKLGKFIFLEARNPPFGEEEGIPRTLEGKILLRFLQLLGASGIPVLKPLAPLCLFLPCLFSCKDTSHLGSGPARLQCSLNLIITAKTLSPDITLSPGSAFRTDLSFGVHKSTCNTVPIRPI